MTHYFTAKKQEDLEYKYSKKYIKDKFNSYYQEDSDTALLVGFMAQALYEWLEASKEGWYESKQQRWAKMLELNSRWSVVQAVLTAVLMLHKAPIQSMVSYPLSLLDWDTDPEKPFEFHKCIAEVLTVLQQFDCWVINPAVGLKSMSVTSNYECPVELRDIVNEVMYLPPMLVRPEYRTEEDQYDYLTIKSNHVLNTTKEYKGKIGLDAINKLNQAGLKLDPYILSFEEEATFELDSTEKVAQYTSLKNTSRKVYDLIQDENEGNFWLTWKADKRGRLYSQGYQINIQSDDFKKSLISTQELFYL